MADPAEGAGRDGDDRGRRVARLGDLMDAGATRTSDPVADLDRSAVPAADHPVAGLADLAATGGTGERAAPVAEFGALGSDERATAPVAGLDGDALTAPAGAARTADLDSAAGGRRRGRGVPGGSDAAPRAGRRPGGGRSESGRATGRRDGARSYDRSPDLDAAVDREADPAAARPGGPDDAGPDDGAGSAPERGRGRRSGRERSGRERPGPGPGRGGGLDPDADPVAVAREICLRLLTDRARTRHELAQALARKEIPADVADQVLGRFDEVGLIDDAAFAGQWVRSRHRFRGLGRRAIAQELRRKGVDDEIAGEALAEVDGAAEEQRARELVDKKLRSMRLDGPDDRTVAMRRLVGMLARKGYGGGVAYGVVRAALAEHGTDPDEFDGAEPPDDD